MLSHPNARVDIFFERIKPLTVGHSMAGISIFSLPRVGNQRFEAVFLQKGHD
jgi:hypothetical protein